MRLQACQLSKSFGTQRVLRDVSFEVEPGEVHVLAGENGAGKSTLVNILCGATRADSGEVRVDGRPVRWSRPLDAANAGIATIHQELPLVGAMSVTDNLFLGRERVGRLGAMRFADQRAEAERLLAEVGLAIDPGVCIEQLSVAERQLCAIARALGLSAEVLLMDEPTSALDDAESALLASRVEALCRQGKAIVFITHRLEEIYRLAHRITVLRDGACMGTAAVADLPRDELVARMAGRKLERMGAHAARKRGGLALEVRDLHLEASLPGRPPDLAGVGFEAFHGEVLGVAGLRGSGASELLHALYGSHPRRPTGSVELDGAAYRVRGPREALARGVVLLAGDRQAALVPELDVVDNATLSALDRFVRAGFVDRRAQQRATEEVATRFRLRAPSLRAPVRTLSGGNQQKVLVARSALSNPRVLLLDEPTRGVDVGAKVDIYDAIDRATAQGAAVLLATSDTEELVELADRIVVLYRGKVAATLERGATREEVVAAAVGAGA